MKTVVPPPAQPANKAATPAQETAKELANKYPLRMLTILEAYLEQALLQAQTVKKGSTDLIENSYFLSPDLRVNSYYFFSFMLFLKKHNPTALKNSKHKKLLSERTLKDLIADLESSLEIEHGIEWSITTSPSFYAVSGTVTNQTSSHVIYATNGYVEVAFIRKQQEEVEKKLTKISIHTVSQFYGDNKQLSLFSDEKIDAFSTATGLSITNRPDSYGVVLNQSQRKVLEGILKAFTDSNYKGDEEIDKATYSSNIYPVNKVPGAYSNVDKIPVIRLTQSEIIKLSGHDRTQGDKVDVVEAISFLATKQFCFYWVRLKKEKGKPVKDTNGDYVKEEVMEVGSLFRIKTVRAENGELQYYEIHPSAPLLDQVNTYFLLVPNDWREEVKQITGKRASSYTYELLLWLRLQYEHIRRYNDVKNRKKKPFKISKSWEEVAIALKMPETMYKANRKRASMIIQDAYSTAIKLGYLIKVENNGATDILYLNESYYPKPGELI
jgi:hypothetical protein